MTYTLFLKPQRAQLIVNNLNNGTKIVGEPNADGYAKIEIVINDSTDVLFLYHSGIDAAAQMDKEFAAEVGW
jgi:hypothetical protein